MLEVGTYITTYNWHLWTSIPDELAADDYYFWQPSNPDRIPNEILGKTTFTVLQDAKIGLIVNSIYGGGGHNQGPLDWGAELTPFEQMYNDGWQLTDLTFSSVRDNGAYPNEWIYMEKNCTAGETYTYRTRKYLPPFVVVQNVPEPKSNALLFKTGIPRPL